MRRAIAIGLWCLLGCIESFDLVDPEVGGAARERCADDDTDPDNAVSFSQDILPILQRTEEAAPGCYCHQPTNPNPIGFEQTGLDLSSYAGLRAGGVRSHGNIVVPRKPCSSILWQKISAGPPFGARMPFDGPPFLSAAERARISDWIAEGARDN